MSVIRTVHVRDYTVVDNELIKDTNLSLKAKGLALIMLSLPDDWRFTEKWLTSQTTDGISAYQSAISELETRGYLVRKQIKDERGKFGANDYTLYEVPLSKNPLSENPITENPTLPNTKEPNTERQNTKEQIYEIVEYLNMRTGSKYRAKTPATVKLIGARLKEGYTLEDFKTVIDNKVSDWLKDSKMSEYLRPQTLFGNKFEAYLNQKPKQSEYERFMGELQHMYDSEVRNGE